MIEKLLEKYFGLQLGFHETMSGYCLELTDPSIMNPYSKREPLFEFTITASAPAHKLFNRKDDDFMLTHIEGIVTMDGICKDAEVMDGTLHLDIFGNQKLAYDFRFKPDDNDDKRIFEYHGIKDLSLRHPLESMTTLYGEIIAGKEGTPTNVYTTVCRFDLKTLPEFMYSFLQNIKA